MLAKITAFLIAWGPAGILLLAFIDSAGIPVSAGMDALVILVAAKDPHRAWLGAALAVAGSAAGNVLLFLTARRGGRRLAQREPGRFRRWFYRYGLLTVFVPALVPIPLPLKVFVILEGALHKPLSRFIAVILLARAIRYFGEAWMGVALGKQSGAFLRSHAWQFIAFAALLFIGLYLVIAVRTARE